MFLNIGLRVLMEIVYERIDRKGLIVILRPRTQLNTSKMSPGCSAGGGGTAMNGPANMGKIQLVKLHIIPASYSGEYNRSSYVLVHRDCPALTSLKSISSF